MNLLKSVWLAATLATILFAVHMHDRAFRFDIVAVGAGSGGSQDEAGDTEVDAYLIDHQTGKVWTRTAEVWVSTPFAILGCEKYFSQGSMMGCTDSPLNSKTK